jgi:peptide deformylase
MRLITNLSSKREEFEKKLRYQCEPVERVTDSLKTVALDLLETMYRSNAIGLAANQVGLKIRLCALDPAWMHGQRLPIVMFNPEFVECGEELFQAPEGCLSLPEMGLQVPRFRNIKVKFLGLDNKEYVISDDNSLLSSVLQHEIDHLDGVLMTDRIVERVDIKYKDSITLKGE